jgi:hypothetical protein
VTTAAVFSPKFITVLGCNLLRGTTTLDCALLETFFHDLPCKAGFKPVSKRKLIVKVHSIVLPKIGLHIVDLGTIALHKLGIDRAHLDRNHESVSTRGVAVGHPRRGRSTLTSGSQPADAPPPNRRSLTRRR